MATCIRLVGLVALLVCVGYVVADHNCEAMPGYCNSGECHDASTAAVWTNPTCFCKEPFEGPQCERRARTCRDKPCMNGGTCVASSSPDSRYDYFSCNCVPGYDGALCEYMNPCLSNPCQNGGTCTDASSAFVPDFSCTCARNVTHTWTGKFCQTIVDYQSCDPSFADMNRLCQNGGTCVKTSLAKNYTCVCTSPYSGAYCATKFCDSSPCMNGATCTNTNTGGFCSCASGFSGTYCSINATTAFCQPISPCLNGAKCSVITGKCECPAYFNGTYCETELWCDRNYCQNGATCSNGPKTCTCPAYYYGRFCEFSGYSPAGCALSGCRNGVCPCTSNTSCVTTNWNTRCTCNSASSNQYYGDCRCNTTVPSACVGGDNKCQHGGTCMDIMGGYICQCRTGFYGLHCENYVNPCASNPCKNQAQCSTFAISARVSFSIYPTRDHYTWRCACKYPYYGNDCSQMTIGTSVCANNPCQNAGNCTVNSFPFSPQVITNYFTGRVVELLPNGLPFSCACPTYSWGPRCEYTYTLADLNDYYAHQFVTPTNCSVNMCQNGGTCTVDISSKTCACPCGFTGKYCQYKASSSSLVNQGIGQFQDFCATNPCNNGGTCLTSPDGRSFICLCAPGYESNVATSEGDIISAVQQFCSKYVGAASSVYPTTVVVLLSFVIGLFASLRV